MHCLGIFLGISVFTHNSKRVKTVTTPPSSLGSQIQCCIHIKIIMPQYEHNFNYCNNLVRENEHIQVATISTAQELFFLPTPTAITAVSCKQITASCLVNSFTWQEASEDHIHRQTEVNSRKNSILACTATGHLHATAMP